MEHLKSHNQTRFYNEALEFLTAGNIALPVVEKIHDIAPSGCPGSATKTFSKSGTVVEEDSVRSMPELTHWPVQLHLISPMAAAYSSADVVLSADCVAYAYADFHMDWLAGKALAIACPKLDEGKEEYAEKISSLIDDAKINTLTVLTMEVPCCAGLLRLAQQAAALAKRRIPLKSVIIGIKGTKLSEEWV